MPFPRFCSFLYFALSGLAVAQLGLAFDRTTAMIFLLVAGFCLSLAVAEIERSVRGQNAFRFKTDVHLSESMQKSVRAISCVVPIGALLIGILSAAFSSHHQTADVATVPTKDSEKIEALKTESGKKFDPAMIFSVGIHNSMWVAIPDWFAGTWKHKSRTVHRHPCAVTEVNADRFEEANCSDNCGTFESEGVSTHGYQQDSQGAIWDCFYPGKPEVLTGGGTTVYSYPVKTTVSGSANSVRIASVVYNFTVDSDSTIVTSYWTKENSEYTPSKSKNAMRAMISMETFDQPAMSVDTINDITKLDEEQRTKVVRKMLSGKTPNYTATQTQYSYKVSDFAPIDSANGYDIKALFKTALRKSVH